MLVDGSDLSSLQQLQQHQQSVMNVEGVVVITPWLMSPERQRLAVSPPKPGPGHLAYKLFKQCPPPPPTTTEPPPNPSLSCNGFVVTDTTPNSDDSAPPTEVKEAGSKSNKLVLSHVKRSLGKTPPPRRRRKKYQLANTAAAMLLKRRQELLLAAFPLGVVNSSSIAKENSCDSSSQTEGAVAVAELPAFVSVRPEEEQLDAAADSSGDGEDGTGSQLMVVPSTPTRGVLKDRNAEKAAATNQATSWHRWGICTLIHALRTGIQIQCDLVFHA
jgi:hypothetical protein